MWSQISISGDLIEYWYGNGERLSDDLYTCIEVEPEAITPMNGLSELFTLNQSNKQQLAIDGYRINDRGYPQLISQGFAYTLYKRLPDDGKVVWRCVKRCSKKCRAYLVTRGEKVVDAQWRHSHDITLPDTDQVTEEILFSKFMDLDEFLRGQGPEKRKRKCKSI